MKCKDLAVYEKEPETVVKISEEVMLRDGFGENPRFGCLIAEEIGGCGKNDALPKKRAVGYAVFFHTYSTWKGKSLYMEDLYVDPACRGKGIGKEILKKVSQIAVKKECVRLDWNVLDWNKVAVDFYDNLGAERLDELRRYRLSGEQLIEFADN
ncbi:thialysine N-epsilon-acetyltransferase-like isoform X2 [Acropora millepora]|uniref:thialysine N-epsilon-acetyltransferase-like isoform X2 n=1 Tax=Acropora millepora TaxID=45264 RepID=UPI001CF418F5|nr:thialysine N-epsilon-acetyltransferase-like isoform X2 [Acropora millepora]